MTWAASSCNATSARFGSTAAVWVSLTRIICRKNTTASSANLSCIESSEEAICKSTTPYGLPLHCQPSKVCYLRPQPAHDLSHDQQSDAPLSLKSSRYLPVLQQQSSPSSSSSTTSETRKRDPNRRQSENTKRRATLNSRVAYDEDEMLRRAIEESKGEVATLGKRTRDEAGDEYALTVPSCRDWY